MDNSVNTDFFLFLAESLISMCDNMVRTDSISTDFHLLQTSFLVPTLRTCLIQQTNWDHDQGQRAYVITIVASWERPASHCNYVSVLDTSFGCFNHCVRLHCSDVQKLKLKNQNWVLKIETRTELSRIWKIQSNPALVNRQTQKIMGGFASNFGNM